MPLTKELKLNRILFLIHSWFHTFPLSNLTMFTMNNMTGVYIAYSTRAPWWNQCLFEVYIVYLFNMSFHVVFVVLFFTHLSAFLNMRLLVFIPLFSFPTVSKCKHVRLFQRHENTETCYKFNYMLSLNITSSYRYIDIYTCIYRLRLDLLLLVCVNH